MTVVVLFLSALMTAWALEVYLTRRYAAARIVVSCILFMFAAITIGAGIQLLFRG